MLHKSFEAQGAIQYEAWQLRWGQFLEDLHACEGNWALIQPKVRWARPRWGRAFEEVICPLPCPLPTKGPCGLLLWEPRGPERGEMAQEWTTELHVFTLAVSSNLLAVKVKTVGHTFMSSAGTRTHASAMLFVASALVLGRVQPRVKYLIALWGIGSHSFTGGCWLI